MRCSSSVLVASATLAVFVSAVPQQQTVTMTATATAGQGTETIVAGSVSNAATGSNSNADANSGSDASSNAAVGNAAEPAGGNSTGGSAGQMKSAQGDSPEGWGPPGEGGWWGKRKGWDHGGGYHGQNARTVSRVIRRGYGSQEGNEGFGSSGDARHNWNARRAVDEDTSEGYDDDQDDDGSIPQHEARFDNTGRSREKRADNAGIAPSWHDVRMKSVHQQKRSMPGIGNKQGGDGDMGQNQWYGHQDRRNMPGGPGVQGGGNAESTGQMQGLLQNGGLVGKGHQQRRDIPDEWNAGGLGGSGQPQNQQQNGGLKATGGRQKRDMPGGSFSGFGRDQAEGQSQGQSGSWGSQNGAHQRRRNEHADNGKDADDSRTGVLPSSVQATDKFGNRVISRDMPSGEGTWMPSGIGNGGSDQNRAFSGGSNSQGLGNVWNGAGKAARRGMDQGYTNDEARPFGDYSGRSGERPRGMSFGGGHEGADMVGVGPAIGRGDRQQARDISPGSGKHDADMVDGGARAGKSSHQARDMDLGSENGGAKMGHGDGMHAGWWH